MKKMKTALLGLALLCLFGSANAQKKYAVLITGDYAAKNLPAGATKYGNGALSDEKIAMAFWNDTYLTWKMLKEKGFEEENIIVLFADGQDFTVDNSWVHSNYKPIDNVVITDYPADIASVTNVFNGLRYGTNGMPKCTEEDFLFVWTFDHGAVHGDHVSLCLLDGEMMDYTFAALVNPIAAYKKTVWMLQCFSGGFADDFSVPNTVFYAAASANELAWPADNSPSMEYEVINGLEYSRSDFNFHFVATNSGVTPWESTNYGSTPLSSADINQDKLLSFHEAYLWSRLRIGSSAVFADIDNIGYTTSLRYPTILLNDITESSVCTGDIALIEDVVVRSGNTLTITKNSKIDFGGINFLSFQPNLIVESGASLIIEDNVTINVTINSDIIVNGNITIGKNVVFNVVDGDNSIVLSSLEINNRRSDIVLDKITVNYLPIEINTNSVKVVNCSFDESANVTLGAPNVQVVTSTFNKSTLKASWMRAGGILGFTSAVVESNNYTGSGATAIDLSGYENYNITENTISGRINGIQLFHAGTGAANSQMVSNNAITNCSAAALVIYNTTGAVENNRIENNYCGVKLLNGSNVSMVGNSEAADIFDTQLIKDNTTHQVYATEYSFPWYIKFNAIIDDVNTVPLVQYDRPNELNFIKVNIADNF